MKSLDESADGLTVNWKTIVKMSKLFKKLKKKGE